jgi:hypothetical protein
MVDFYTKDVVLKYNYSEKYKRMLKEVPPDDEVGETTYEN